MAEPRQPVRGVSLDSLQTPFVAVFKGIRRPALDHPASVQNESRVRDGGELAMEEGAPSLILSPQSPLASMSISRTPRPQTRLPRTCLLVTISRYIVMCYLDRS